MPSRYPPTLTIVVLALGIVLFLIGCLLGDPANATIGYHLLNILITGIIWLVVLGLVALFISAIASQVRRLWLPVFSWLLLSAATLETGVHAVGRFVVRPHVLNIIAGLASDPANGKGFSDPIVFSDSRNRFHGVWPAGWAVAHEYFHPKTLAKAERVVDGHFAMLTVEATGKSLPRGASWPVTGESLFDLMIPDLMGASLLGSGMESINGKHVVWIKVESSDFGLISKTWYFFREQAIYAFSGTTDANQPWFERNEPTFDEAARSFRLWPI